MGGRHSRQLSAFREEQTVTTTPILWRTDQQANTTDTGTNGDDQTQIRMVGLANGNFVALWESNTDDGAGSSGGTDIIGQLYDPEGNPIGGEFRANNGFFADDEGDFTAAALPGGGFVIAYEDTDINGTAIRYNILDANGVNVTTGTIASDPGDPDLGAPSVTVNTDGSFLVSYQSRDIATNQTDTFATIVNASGVAGSPFLLLDGSLSDDVGAGGQQVDVTTLTNGNYVIIARQIDGDSGFNMRIINPAGGNVLGFTEVSGTLGDAESDVAPTVAALSGGGFVVVWQNTDANDTDVLFQRYDAAGAAVGGQVNVDDDSGTDNDVSPDVVGLSDGGFVVVWDNNENGTIALKRFSSAGVLVGTEQVIATDLFATNGSPHISLADDGRLLVSWGTSLFTGGGNFDTDVRFSVWDPRETTITGDGTSEVITAFADGGTVEGLGGNDTIFGRDAADILRGGDGDDTIHGRGGNDLIEGGFNADRIFGDDGDDIIFAMTQADPGGSGVKDIISGGGGNDTITGSAAGDTIGGNDGNDLLEGGAGGDYLSGGTGSDRILYATASAGVVVNLTNAALNTGDAAGDTYNSIENITGSGFDDSLTGNNAKNSILGGAGVDSLTGLGGSDNLFGNDGNDTLDGGIGADYLSGGAGSDRATYINATAAVKVHLSNAAVNTGEAAGDTYNSVENITGSNFGDSLTGSDGANRISGADGNDTINGLKGNDVIFGGAGNDRIYGHLGNDTLEGNAGNDTFIFHQALGATNVDTIEDFNFTDDSIELFASIFSAIVGTGTLTAAQFVANAAGTATTAAHRIIYDTSDGRLIYDSNGTGAGGDVVFAILDPGLGVSNTDFIIV